MKKFIVAIAALAMLTGSAYAADWNFYGNARVQTFTVDTDTAGTSDRQTVWSKLGTGRIGANVKVSDELSGRFEYGSADDVNLRLLYGEWNFGAGSLVVGQDWVPTLMWGSGQVYDDMGLGGWGELGGARAAQLKLKMGGLRLALIAPSTGVIGAGVVSSEEVTFPQLSVKYIFTADTWSARVLGAYQTYEINDAYDVDSYVIGVGADATLGALYFNATLFMGDNIGNLYNEPVVTSEGYATFTGTEVVDNESVGFRVCASYAVNDMFSVEAGWGNVEVESDAAGATKEEVTSYYINAPITVAPGVVITPEIGVVDNKDTDVEVTYMGAKWQINF